MTIYTPSPNFDLRETSLGYTPSPNFDFPEENTNIILIQSGWDSSVFGTTFHIEALFPTISTVDPLYEYTDGGSWIQIRSNLGDITSNTTVKIDGTLCEEIWVKDNTELYAKLPPKPIGNYSIEISNIEHGTAIYPLQIQYIEPGIGPAFDGTVPVRMMTAPYPPSNLNSGRTPNRQNAIAYYEDLNTYRTYGFSLSWVHLGESAPNIIDVMSYININTVWYVIWRIKDGKYVSATINPSGTLSLTAQDPIPIVVEIRNPVDTFRSGNSSIALQSDINIVQNAGWDSSIIGGSSYIASGTVFELNQINGWDSSVFSANTSIELQPSQEIALLSGWDSLVFNNNHRIKLEPIFDSIAIYTVPSHIEYALISLVVCNSNDTSALFRLAISSHIGVVNDHDYIGKDIIINENGGKYNSDNLIVSPGERIVGFFDKPCSTRLKSIQFF